MVSMTKIHLNWSGRKTILIDLSSNLRCVSVADLQMGAQYTNKGRRNEEKQFCTIDYES